MDVPERPLLYGFCETGGVLECASGHQIKKYKKLKPWQGLVVIKRCGVCTVDLHRNDMRWRCEEHCEYNICEECYNYHYLSLIEKASASDNPKKREKILGAIPQHLRSLPEYETAKNWVPPPPPEENGTSASSTENGKSKKVKGAKGAKTPIDGPESESWLVTMEEQFTSLPDLVKVVVWSTLWLAGMLLLAFSIRALLLDEELAFPNAWLLVGISNGVAFGLCELTVIIFVRYGRLGHYVDFKPASCFGVMHCLQLSLGIAGLRSSEIYHNVMTLGYTLTLGIAGILGQAEKPNRELILSLVFVGIGGLMSVSLQGTYTLGGLFGTNVLICQLPSLMIGTSRLILTANFLNMENVNAAQRHIKQSPLILAAHMMPATAVTSFELGFISDYTSYTRLEQMPYKGKVAGLLCIIGVGYFVVAIAEMQLLQLTPVTIMGLLIPCSLVCYVSASTLVTDMFPFHVSLLLLVCGVVLTVVAFILYGAHRKLDEPKEQNGYRRLEGNEGERRHRSKRNRGERSLSPRSERTQSPRSPRHPPQGGGGVDSKPCYFGGEDSSLLFAKPERKPERREGAEVTDWL